MMELAGALTPDAEVEVLTAQPRYNGSYARRPTHERHNGVSIRRLPATRFSKHSSGGRMANWLSFLVSAALAAWRHKTPSKYLFVTNPPTAPWAVLAAKARGQQTYVLVHDLYPDLAEAIGAVKAGGLPPRVFDALNRWALRHADGVIVLGAQMEARLRAKLGPRARIEVIPNWADGRAITPRPKKMSSFAAADGLNERFVFLYAGNLGLFQDLDTLIEAVEGLQTVDGREPVLVFVGNGGKREAIQARARRSERVIVRHYVAYDERADMYAAADVGLIAIEPGVAATNVPSKTYTLLAAGRPFLAVAAGQEEIEALAADGCGVCVPNDVTAVREAMQSMMWDTLGLRRKGRRARVVFEERYDLPLAVARYRAVLGLPAVDAAAAVAGAKAA
jgi:glycosyltransferase involved in cell wall biosynthesis